MSNLTKKAELKRLRQEICSVSEKRKNKKSKKDKFEILDAKQEIKLKNKDSLFFNVVSEDDSWERLNKKLKIVNNLDDKIIDDDYHNSDKTYHKNELAWQQNALKEDNDLLLIGFSKIRTVLQQLLIMNSQS
jgi:hypothetical protein